MSATNQIWVVTLIERGRTIVQNPVLASFLTLGWIPLVASVVVLVAGNPSQEFAIAQLLTASIVILGPYQAYKYDTEVLPGFFDDVTAIIEQTDHDRVDRLRIRALRLFRDKNLVFVLVWTAMVVSVLPLNGAYFAAQGIGPTSPLYWVYLVFLVDFGVLSGLGLFSVLVTIYSIRAIAGLELQIEPLHPDGLGGLSTIGEFAIWTTLLISNGALAIPLSLDMVSSASGGVVVYSGIGLYLVLIVLSFVYPTAKVNRRAQNLREEHLEHYRSMIRSLEQDLSLPKSGEVTNQDLALQMEIERTRKEFQDYRNVRLYPLSIDILARLITSVLLPVAFILLEQYLSRLF